MSAYVIVRIAVTDPEAYEEYRKRAPATVEKFGGRFLARGGQTVTLEGDENGDRNVILEFDSVETIKRWYNSPEYQEAKGYRDNVSVGSFVAIDGV